MSHRPVHAAHLPTPVGPYSPGMAFERLSSSPARARRIRPPGAWRERMSPSQTEQCLRNVQAILEAAGSSLQHVLRCGVFLMDMGSSRR